MDLRAQQRLIPLERQCLLSGNRLRRLQRGPGDFHIGSLFAVIEARENIAGVDGRTDVDTALNHPAADPERQLDWIRAFTSPVISALG